MKHPTLIASALTAAAALLALVAAPPTAAASPDSASKRKVAIVVYEGMEILDFAGPAEVFAANGDDFEVYTVAETKEPILSQGFVTITPRYSIADSPQPSILVIPGGGTGAVRNSETMMKWIARTARDAETVLTVCTGAFVLADAGLLDGLEATTWHGAIDRFRKAAPKTIVHENVRFVDNGKFITTAGVSAGIDGALHVVAKLHGQDAAAQTARYMEYDKWRPSDGRIVGAAEQRRPASE